MILTQTSRIYSDTDELRRRWIMIGGEGAVFLSLMVVGIYRVQRSFRKEGELLSRQKTFLHSITHEFKSPVASMRLQLETLLKRNLTEEQQHTSLNNALEDTDRLDQLLEKTLVAARIDNGELPLFPESVDISAILIDCMDKVIRSNPNRKIIQHIEKRLVMYIDTWAFNSIALNLVENALLYSATGTAVEVDLSSNKGNVVLTVKDTGIGIPDAEKKKIFEKFYRLNSSGGYKGTGLGLFLADYLVKKNKGAISVRNNLPQGSIFEAVFPNKINEIE